MSWYSQRTQIRSARGQVDNTHPHWRWCRFSLYNKSRSLNLFSIQWLGYKAFKRQVQIRDETSVQNPITISKFAHHIGRSVDAFLKVKSSDLLRVTAVLSWFSLSLGL